MYKRITRAAVRSVAHRGGTLPGTPTTAPVACLLSAITGHSFFNVQGLKRCLKADEKVRQVPNPALGAGYAHEDERRPDLPCSRCGLRRLLATNGQTKMTVLASHASKNFCHQRPVNALEVGTLATPFTDEGALGTV
jgi:hypothetical protein